VIDWIVFFDNVMIYVQWFTSLTFFGLIGIACIGFFISKRITLNCLVVVIALFIIAYIVDDSFGLQLFAPEIMDFLQQFL
jgi:hypothetical protein